jgi:molybdate transport system substrate-binding protein
MMPGRFLLVGCTLAMMPAAARASDAVLLHAAGSLRGALTEMAQAFEVRTKLKVHAKFGASGLLKDEVVAGAKAEVFASANMQHPEALSAAGRSGPVVRFARNQLCALVRPGLSVSSETLLDRMLDLQVKLATSTPKADPSGDYAWEVFRKAEAIRRGSFAALENKALQLTGGPASPQPPPGKSLYGTLVAQGAADIFLTYCTNAQAARQEHPEQSMVTLPQGLAVGADYGMTVMMTASSGAFRLAMFVLSADGQRILARHGFTAPNLP